MQSWKWKSKHGFEYQYHMSLGRQVLRLRKEESYPRRRDKIKNRRIAEELPEVPHNLGRPRGSSIHSMGWTAKVGPTPVYIVQRILSSLWCEGLSRLKGQNLKFKDQIKNAKKNGI